MAARGCTRCGGYHMLQVTHPIEDEEVRLCLWCRRKAAEESMVATQERMRGKDGDG